MIFITYYVDAKGEASRLCSVGWLGYGYDMFVLWFFNCKRVTTVPTFNQENDMRTRTFTNDAGNAMLFIFALIIGGAIALMLI